MEKELYEEQLKLKAAFIKMTRAQIDDVLEKNRANMMPEAITQIRENVRLIITGFNEI